MPSRKEWKDKDYALIIYTALRLCARPLPVTSNTKEISKKKENLQEIITKHYGNPEEKGQTIRRQTISDNINSMMAVDLPIKKEGNKVAFDTTKMLTLNDLKLLEDCIKQNNALATDVKSNLLDKLNKFNIVLE